jgi:hypothetical protein
MVMHISVSIKSHLLILDRPKLCFIRHSPDASHWVDDLVTPHLGPLLHKYPELLPFTSMRNLHNKNLNVTVMSVHF